MIDPSLFTVERLLATMLDDESGNRDKWRKFAEIVPGYMPPFPRPETRPTLVVRYGTSMLRYSKGPRQGYFWDLYGDDFYTAELALMALLQAPVPPSRCKREEWERWRAVELARRDQAQRDQADPMDLIICDTYGCQNLKHRNAVFCSPCAAEYRDDPEAYK